jgi:hypothetical protein
MRISEESMDQFGQEQLDALLAYQAVEEEGDRCISIYLPSEIMGAETKRVPLQLTGILDTVQEQLIAQGMRAPDAQALLKPARDLLVGARAPFWQHQREGLAVFIAKRLFAHYRLPIAFTEQVTINTHFVIRPLVPLLTGNGEFYLLALSEKKVRFFHGTRDAIEEIPLRHAPHSLADTLRHDEVEKQVTQHSAGSSGLGRGRGAAIFHGQGDAGDAAINRKNILRFLQEVNEEVSEKLRGLHIPLAIAGVESMQGLYRSVSDYPAIFQDELRGNPDRLNAQELHQRAWTMLAPHFHQPKEAALEQFNNTYKKEGQTHHDWRNVLIDAHHKRVQTLFFPENVQLWGTFDRDSLIIATHDEAEPGDIDLVNMAIADTLRNRGEVYALPDEEMPARLPVAAILRA